MLRPPPFSGATEREPTLMLVTSGAGGDNWRLDLLMYRISRRLTAVAFLLTSRIFLSGSEGESAGSEQSVKDANRNKAWTSLIILSQPFYFFAACCVIRDASLITPGSLDVAVIRLSLMFVDCGGLRGRRDLRQLLKKSSSFGCTSTELRADSSTSPQVASHKNWRK